LSINICDEVADKFVTKASLCKPEVDDSYKIYGSRKDSQGTSVAISVIVVSFC
jgi:hypothetical protein